MKQRIVFLISDTGGGHRASAQAIAEAIHFRHPEKYEIVVEDLWANHTPHPFRDMPRTYRWIVGPGLPLWKLMWHAMSQPTLQRQILDDVARLVSEDVKAYFRAIQPDLVVSVHPLLNHIGLDSLRAVGSAAPFATVVTDLFTFHPTWIEPRVSRCIVPTGAARTQAIQLGMAPDKIAVYGQPVSIRFAAPRSDKDALRQALALEPTRPAVLLTGGGEGGGRMVSIARHIAQSVPRVQLLVVTGRNHAVRKNLASIDWEVPTQIYGFVQNMDELMYASDLIVTKAGPGTISEALIAGLPIILSAFIPGQETGNVDYIQRNGAGIYCATPTEIARTVDRWTRPGNPEMAQFRANCARLARPQASLDIAEDLCYLVAHGTGLPVGDRLSQARPLPPGRLHGEVTDDSQDEARLR